MWSPSNTALRDVIYLKLCPPTFEHDRITTPPPAITPPMVSRKAKPAGKGDSKDANYYCQRWSQHQKQPSTAKQLMPGTLCSVHTARKRWEMSVSIPLNLVDNIWRWNPLRYCCFFNQDPNESLQNLEIAEIKLYMEWFLDNANILKL